MCKRHPEIYTTRELCKPLDMECCSRSSSNDKHYDRKNGFTPGLIDTESIERAKIRKPFDVKLMWPGRTDERKERTDNMSLVKAS
uniref:Uncharacterized protein n=1 Tax=Romanomermis culicivorax TaxID=13658 RepID=A0A915I7H3_ROMCU